MSNFAFTLVMMPPHTSVRRKWVARISQDEIGVRVRQPETISEAMRDIADADAAFGTVPPEVLAAALRHGRTALLCEGREPSWPFVWRTLPQLAAKLDAAH
jgi:hypothetical protein